MDSTSLQPGASFTLSATVSNAGDAGSAATTLRYYRSADATITAADTQVGMEAVGALAASGTSAGSVSLTAPATAGTYYYGACVDAVTDESNTTNNCSVSVEVTVVAVSLQQSGLSVEVSAEDDRDWAPVGNTVDLSARVLDDEGREVAGATVAWASSDDTVATVSASGVMTAVGEGSVTLTATATVTGSGTEKMGTDSITMTVVKRAARVAVTPATVALTAVGASEDVTATVYDAGDNVMSPHSWTWSSADVKVATVDHAKTGITGSVQAVGEGTTTVSLSANDSATGERHGDGDLAHGGRLAELADLHGAGADQYGDRPGPGRERQRGQRGIDRLDHHHVSSP